MDFSPYGIINAYSHLFFEPVYVILTNGLIERSWRSRAHRKGKPVSFVIGLPAKHVELFKTWDVSWWTAVFFLVGSMFWIANGAVAFHEPIKDAPTSRAVMGYTAFAGGTMFYCGGWTMYWEALNVEQKADFDIAVRKQMRVFSAALKRFFLCRSRRTPKPRWRWIGWNEVTDINFSANFFQFMGTSVFWVSVIAGFPGLLPDEQTATMDLSEGIFWFPQILGAFLLIVSSYLLTIESQKRLWIPELDDLGWHVGFWNLLGSLGFFLSGLFGWIFNQDMKTSRHWGVNFSTYLGSYFFLLGSFLQYVESVQT